MRQDASPLLSEFAATGPSVAALLDHSAFFRDFSFAKSALVNKKAKKRRDWGQRQRASNRRLFFILLSAAKD
jgi:hypothetical protein